MARACLPGSPAGCDHSSRVRALLFSFWKPAGAFMEFDHHLQFKMPTYYEFSTLNEAHQSPPAEVREKNLIFFMSQNTQFRNSSAQGGSTNLSHHHTPTGGNCFVIRQKKRQKLLSVNPWSPVWNWRCSPANWAKSTGTWSTEWRRWFPENTFIGRWSPRKHHLTWDRTAFWWDYIE